MFLLNVRLYASMKAASMPGLDIAFLLSPFLFFSPPIARNSRYETKSASIVMIRCCAYRELFFFVASVFSSYVQQVRGPTATAMLSLFLSPSCLLDPTATFVLILPVLFLRSSPESSSLIPGMLLSEIFT